MENLEKVVKNPKRRNPKRIHCSTRKPKATQTLHLPVGCHYQICKMQMQRNEGEKREKKGWAVSFCFRRDIDKVEKVRALREASKRVALGPDNLPSICFYTMLNCAETSVFVHLFYSFHNLKFKFSNLFFQGYVRRILWRFVTISRRVFWFNP